MKRFLRKKFGKQECARLRDVYRQKLDWLLHNLIAKSESQARTLRDKILPTIALYQALLECGVPESDAYKTAREFKHAAVRRVARLYKALDAFPFFFRLYRHLFSIGLKSDNWAVMIQANDNRAFAFTIKKCLWHDACAAYNCPELCGIFCDSDDILYGTLSRMRFERTETLGAGGSSCDFRFYPR